MAGAIEGASIVTVLRHGAVAGRPFVYRGRQDDPLSELGWRQMEAVVQHWQSAVGADRVRDGDARHRGQGPLPQEPAFTAIASSPLQRCAAFAQDLADRYAVPLHVSPAFQEIAFGEWEGLTAEEAAQRNPLEHPLFRAGSGAAPGGESLGQVSRRVLAGWQEWLDDSKGGRRLLVTHAGVMRALLIELLGLPASHVYRIALPEAAHFRVSLLAGEAPILLSLNSTP